MQGAGVGSFIFLFIILFTKATITVGYMLTPLLQSRYDCKNISAFFLLVTSLAMLMMGLSFTYPAMSLLIMPSLVVAALSFGLGQSPTLSLVERRPDTVL